MNLKYSALNKTVAPGIQQQQQAEAASKQRAAQAAHAQSAAHAAYSMQMNQFQTPPNAPPPMYNGMYSPQQAPPPYPTHPAGYAHQMNLMPNQMPQSQYAPSQSLYAQATTRAGRQRASTMDHQGGVPPTIQRVASHLDPNAPIRLQPSPAYYPPPADGYMDTGSAANQRRRASRVGGNQRNRDFIRTLEDGVMGDAFMNQQWH